MKDDLNDLPCYLLFYFFTTNSFFLNWHWGFSSSTFGGFLYFFQQTFTLEFQK